MSEQTAAATAEASTLDLGWMQRRGEWGMHAKPSRDGLTVADIAIGSYGQVPEASGNMTGRPRGAAERHDGYRIGSYPMRSKHDIWLENAAWIWEEALARQWSSATDVPWHTLKPLPDDIEQAMCNLCTFLTEVEFVAGDVPARWIARTSPDYFEPRMALLAQVNDEARHMDVFRKRALANGGGLLQATGGTPGVVGTIDLANDFNEMSSRLHLSGEGAVLTIFRMGELIAQNDAEKAIYRLCAQDEARHVAFGVMHLRYVSEACPERRDEIHSYLDEAEAGLLASTQSSNPAAFGSAGESLALLLGGGRAGYDEGQKKLLAIRRRQAVEYMKRLRAAGFGDRFDNGRANPELVKMLKAA
jgi:hypothetical protein